MYDVKSHFEGEKNRELVRRRDRLFILNLSACIASLIMLLADIYEEYFVDKAQPEMYSKKESLILVFLRLLQ